MKRIDNKTVFILLLSLMLILLPLSAAARTETRSMALVSLGPLRNGGDYASQRPSISDDGTKIAFGSYATDLVKDTTTNTNGNVFLYDVTTDTTTLITTGSSGLGGDDESRYPEISGDGTAIAFISGASDLIDGFEAHGRTNVYHYDIASQETTLITTGSDGHGTEGWTWLATLSADGKKIAFDSDSLEPIQGLVVAPGNTYGYGHGQIYLIDVPTRAVTRVTKDYDGFGPNAETSLGCISPDGTRVVFNSMATNILPAFETAGGKNVYLYNATTDTSTLITKGPLGGGTNADRWTYTPSAISADNNFVVFSNQATDIIEGLTHDRIYQVYLYDATDDVVSLITKGLSGGEGDDDSFSPCISADGTVIAFQSRASNLGDFTLESYVNSYIFDRIDEEMVLISTRPDGVGGNGGSYRPRVSADGSQITFHSYATDLLDGVTIATQLPIPTGSGSGQGQGNPDFERETTNTRNVFLFSRIIMLEVTFDAQNGTTNLVVPVQRGHVLPAISTPVKAGYTFAGWWTAPTGGTQWDPTKPVFTDMTLYAHWTKNAPPPIIDPPMPPTGDDMMMLPLALNAVVGIITMGMGLLHRRMR